MIAEPPDDLASLGAPPVTLVVPNFNSGSYLETSVRSIVAESAACPAEVLIIDDASTDASVDLALDLEAEFAQVRVIRKPVNEGLTQARLDGFRAASFEHAAILDADDSLESGAIADAFSRLLRDEADVCVLSMWRVNQDGTTQPRITYEATDFPISGRDAARMTIDEWRIAGAMVARRSLFINAYEALDWTPVHRSWPTSQHRSYLHSDEVATRLLLSQATTVTGTEARYFYWYRQGSITTRSIGHGRLELWRSLLAICDLAEENGYFDDDPALLSTMQRKCRDVMFGNWHSRRELGYPYDSSVIESIRPLYEWLTRTNGMSARVHLPRDRKDLYGLGARFAVERALARHSQPAERHQA